MELGPAARQPGGMGSGVAGLEGGAVMPGFAVGVGGSRGAGRKCCNSMTNGVDILSSFESPGSGGFRKG